MQWSTETPTSTGFYWLRQPGAEPEIVQIIELFDGLRVTTMWSDQECALERVRDAEWYGPLTVPQQNPDDAAIEPKGRELL